MELLFALTPFAAIAVLGYLATCLVWPYRTCRTCRTCRGDGRLPGLLGIRLCVSCNGTGLHIRSGRRGITRAQHAWRRYRHERDNRRRRGQ